MQYWGRAVSLTLNRIWGKSGPCSALWRPSETTGTEEPNLHALVPAWPSQTLVVTVATDPGEAGVAVKLSLHGGCKQAGDASEDSSAPTYRDSKGSMLTEMKDTMGKNDLVEML